MISLLILSGAVCCENHRASFLRSFSFAVNFPGTSSILIDHFATSGQKAVAEEIREFREVFVAPIHYAKVMAAAEYRLRESDSDRTENRVTCPKRTSWASY